MKKIYLWVSGKGWIPFQYNELSELAAEFEARNIKLGDGCTLGDWCKLGDGCTLGDWCKLGDGCTLGDWCELGDGCTLGDWCELGDGCKLGAGCKLGDGCKLGAGCKLGNGCELGRECELGGRCELGDWCDVPKSLFISASRHAVSYWGEDVIQIGCKRYTISEWQKHFRKIGEAEGYSPEQMEEYKGYIDLIATMHKTWALH
jgi:UDP-3-O-[3-hydroxymyristoyl] glucosamine N-acyltransferase